MEPAWWGVIAVAVIGTAVVVHGWWHDRSRHRQAVQAAGRPTREIPGQPRQQSPAYVQEADLLQPSFDPTSTTGEADLFARRDESPTVPAGAADGSFLNRADSGLAALASPVVLVLEGDLDADRDVLTVLAAAKAKGHPLVLVAPDVSDRALSTLRANTLTGRVRTLPVLLADLTQRRRVVALTGGRLVPSDDLSSGWLPDEVWGECAGWICDLDDSWVIGELSTDR